MNWTKLRRRATFDQEYAFWDGHKHQFVEGNYNYCRRTDCLKKRPKGWVSDHEHKFEGSMPRCETCKVYRFELSDFDPVIKQRM
jgi:hypothetical protein